MPLLVVGSVAYDTISTPTETREMVIGGSAVHFSMAASFFAPVRLVGVVGEDWNDEHTQMLSGRGVDMAGLETKPGGKTFFWKGKYHSNMNDRDTLEVHLNVFGDFQPTLPDAFKRSDYVFLANGSPVTQMKVLDQVVSPKLVVADTMDLWIRETHDELLALLKRIDGLVLNDGEAKLLTGEENIVNAGKKIREMGPKFVVVKKGEHGAMFFADHETYVLPAFPMANVVDPTGAGDSFAGGMMGYLAQEGNVRPETLKAAMAHGVLVASFNVEDFSLDRFRTLEKSEIEFRLSKYRQMLAF